MFLPGIRGSKFMDEIHAAKGNSSPRRRRLRKPWVRRVSGYTSSSGRFHWWPLACSIVVQLRYLVIDQRVSACEWGVNTYFAEAVFCLRTRVNCDAGRLRKAHKSILQIRLRTKMFRVRVSSRTAKTAGIFLPLLSSSSFPGTLSQHPVLILVLSPA
jgi:hypothetical protein